MTNVDGVVHVVFATMALGMGIDCVGLTQTIHYGAPRSIDDYFQECGRAGRGGSMFSLEVRQTVVSHQIYF